MIHGYRWSGRSQAGRTDYVGNLGHIWGGWKDCEAVPEFTGPAEYPDLFVRGSKSTPWVNGEWYSDQQRCNGIFAYTGSVRMAEVLDGTGNTILAFEDMHWRGHQRPTTELDREVTMDAAWACPLSAVNTMRNPMNNRNPAWDQWNDIRCHGWSSNHKGGAQAVLCDGSAIFFNEDIDPVVQYSLSVRNDGFDVPTELLPGDPFE